MKKMGNSFPIRRAGCGALLARAILAFWALSIPAAGQEAPPAEEARGIIERAARIVPHPRQLAWQEMEFTCFIHFGVNTFNGVEWGNGKEDPAVFDPGSFDAGQWARTARVAGMKMILLTAKHHDGFCLWPSRYTRHSVAASPWMGGKGDVVKAVAEACRREGLKLGIYLSPADLYQIEHPDGLYGNGSSYSVRTIPRPVEGRPFEDERTFSYSVDDYNEYFMNQLHELLTEYGPVHEVWFDGAHPKRKGNQQYTHDQWYELIRTLAPDAVIAIKGPDVRWCGNEAGRTRPAEWSVIPIGGTPDEWHWPDMTAGDLGSLEKIRSILGQGGHLHWYPSEVNTSIRHGWFWRDERQHVRSVDEIIDIWYRAVGGNGLFLLNVPPNSDGLFAQRDVRVLHSVGSILRRTFAESLTADRAATVTATATARGGDGEVSFEADNILDNDPATCWKPDDWTRSADIVLSLDQPVRFNRVMLQEQIRDFGQRIARFAFDASIDGEWRELAEGTTVGYKRICRFNTVESDRVRIRILDARLCPTLSTFGLYFELVRLSTPVIKLTKEGDLLITCDPPGPAIRYTLDGSVPRPNSPLYSGPIPLRRGGTVCARAFDGDRVGSRTARARFDIAKTLWSVVETSSEESGHGEVARNAIDGDPATIWHTEWAASNPPHPHHIVIDLGEEIELVGFTYLPRSGSSNGTVVGYEFYVSADGARWGTPAAAGLFANIRNNPVEQRVTFDSACEGRFIKFKSLEAVDRKPWASAAEIGVITTIDRKGE